MADGDRRTFADYKNQVRFALGNPDETDMDVTPGSIVNDALEHVAAMHPWNWLTTVEASLDLVADQNYVALPADFGMLVAIHHQGTVGDQMIPTTWEQLESLRAGVVADWDRSFWYVINTGQIKTGPEEGLDAPRLELYPTPASSVSGGITVTYRRFLRRMTTDTDVPQWPSYMDRALSLLARCFAATDYDDDPESAYTAQFRSLIVDLLSRDGLSRRSFGVARGGLFPRTVPISPFYPTSIPDPVQG